MGGASSVGLSIQKGGSVEVKSKVGIPSPGYSVSGEDVREGRASYAPYTAEGRVGSLGEIGAGGGRSSLHSGGSPHAAPLALPGKRVGPPKNYALGSWQK